MLFLTGATHAAELPKTMLGEWCWTYGGEEGQKQNLRIFARIKDCRVPDGRVMIEPDRTYGGENVCKFAKIEKHAHNRYLVYESCEDETSDAATYELIDGKLVITFLPKG